MNPFEELKRAKRKGRIARYLAMTPAEREQYDNDSLIGFIVHCKLPRESVMDAIDNRMTFLSRESAEYIINFLNQKYYGQAN